MSKNNNKTLKEFIDLISSKNKDLDLDLSRVLVIKLISCFIENGFKIVGKLDSIQFKENPLNKKFIAFSPSFQSTVTDLSTIDDIDPLEIGNLVELIKLADQEMKKNVQIDFKTLLPIDPSFIEFITNSKNIKFKDILDFKWLQEREIIVKVIGDDEYNEIRVKVSDIPRIQSSGSLDFIYKHQLSTSTDNNLFIIEYLNNFHLYPILQASQLQLPYQTAEFIYLVNFNDKPLPHIDQLSNYKVGVKISPSTNDFNEYIKSTISNFKIYSEEFKVLRNLILKKLNLLNQSSNVLLKLYTRIGEKIDHQILNSFRKSSILAFLNEFRYRYRYEPILLGYFNQIEKNQLQLVPVYNRTDNLKLYSDYNSDIIKHFNQFDDSIEKLLKSTQYDQQVQFNNTVGQLEQKFIDCYQFYQTGSVKLNESIKSLRSSIQKKFNEVLLHTMHQDSYLFQQNGLMDQLQYSASQLEYLIHSEMKHRERVDNSISFYQFPIGFQLPKLFNQDFTTKNPLSQYLPNNFHQSDSFQTFNETIYQDTKQILEKLLVLDREVSNHPYTNESLESFKCLYSMVDEAQPQVTKELIVEKENVEEVPVTEEEEEEVEIIEEIVEQIVEKDNEDPIYTNDNLEKYKLLNDRLLSIKEQLSSLDLSEDTESQIISRNQNGKEIIPSLQAEIETLQNLLDTEPSIIQYNEMMAQLEEIKQEIEQEILTLENDSTSAKEFHQQYQELLTCLNSSKQEEQDLAEEVEISNKRVVDLVSAYEEKKTALSKQLQTYDKEIQNQNSKLKSVQEHTKKILNNRSELDSILAEKIQEKNNEIKKLIENISSTNEIINVLKSNK